MGELSTFTATIGALMNVKEAELMNLPKVKCHLMTAFKRVQSVKMENAGKLETMKVLKEAQEEEKKKRLEEEEKKRLEEEKKRLEEERKRRLEEEEKRKVEEERKKLEKEKKKMEVEKKKLEEEDKKLAKTVIIPSMNKLTTVDNLVESLKIASNCCNENELKVLDLSRFMNLRELTVGDECFEKLSEVKLIGLKKLRRVVIGRNSFTKHKNSWGNDPNRHFYLKDCKKLKELKMGRYSFSDFTVCEIENVPSLEVIEMGELNKWSYNFRYASLELKSDGDGMK